MQLGLLNPYIAQSTRVNYSPSLNPDAEKRAQNEFKARKQAMFQSRLNKVIAHERAHQSAGGGLAGAMVINANPDTLEVSGHVPIKMYFGKTAAEARQYAAQIEAAATAPGGDMSGQDSAVASQARSMGQTLYAQRKTQEDQLQHIAFGQIPTGGNPFAQPG